MPRWIQFSIFIAILSLVLYTANLVVYEALAALFNLNGVLPLAVLGSALGILSASFIASSILGSHYYNVFTRTYYFLSAMWLGTFAYIFLAALVYGVLILILGLPFVVGEALFAVPLLVSAYGVAHARRILVSKIEVTLQNLPSAWRGRKALFMSDLHLGQIHGPAFARRVAAASNVLSPDIVFIGGDLYDGTGAPDVRELAEPLSTLRAPLGTYFITGNHEEFGDNSPFLAAIKSIGIRVLMDEVVNIDGLQLAGVDYHNAADKEQFKSILSHMILDRAKPTVLLKHEPKDLDVAQEAGVSLQLSGHTHNGQQWPFQYIARWVHKGFSYGLKNFKAMQVYTSSGVGTWGPPLRVGTRSELVLITFATAA